MSLSDSTATIEGTTADTVDVSMKNEPFEMWFPTLDAKSYIEVCASPESGLFKPSDVVTCLDPGRGVVDYTYGSGGFWVTADISNLNNLANTDVAVPRAQSASNGDEKFYVGNLPMFHAQKFYLVIYLNPGSWTLKPNNNIELFVLNFTS